MRQENINNGEILEQPIDIGGTYTIQRQVDALSVSGI